MCTTVKEENGVNAALNVLFGYLPVEVLTLYVAILAALQKPLGTVMAYPPFRDPSDVAKQKCCHVTRAIHKLKAQRARRVRSRLIRIGKLWRFRASALNEWLAKMTG